MFFSYFDVKIFFKHFVHRNPFCTFRWDVVMKNTLASICLINVIRKWKSLQFNGSVSSILLSEIGSIERFKFNETSKFKLMSWWAYNSERLATLLSIFFSLRYLFTRLSISFCILIIPKLPKTWVLSAFSK